MRDFARLPADERSAYVTETAARRNVRAWMVEKDFWVCWMLDRLFALDALKDQLVFKGGTSLSKCFHVIHRFSEDIDLSISPALLGIEEDWLEQGRSNAQRQKRMAKLEQHCTRAVERTYRPLLESAIARELGAAGASWSLAFEIDATTHSPVLVFAFPRAQEYGAYSPPSVKAEFGSLTDQQPTGRHAVRPMIAEEFPGLLRQPDTSVVAMEAERTFWEKATILHDAALRLLDKPFRDRSCRHYYDTVMLAQSEFGVRALSQHDLLERVARFKSLFFASSWSDYASARPSSFRLLPPVERRPEVERDYSAMQDFFLRAPPPMGELWARLGDLEREINGS